MPRPAEIAMFVDDVEACRRFYEAVLGSPPDQSWPGGCIFRAGGLEILLHERYVPGEDDLPCENHFAFAVEELESFCEQLRNSGLRIEYAPRDYPWGRSAYLRDPVGQLVELKQV